MKGAIDEERIVKDDVEDEDTVCCECNVSYEGMKMMLRLIMGKNVQIYYAYTYFSIQL